MKNVAKNDRPDASRKGAEAVGSEAEARRAREAADAALMVEAGKRRRTVAMKNRPIGKCMD